MLDLLPPGRRNYATVPLVVGTAVAIGGALVQVSTGMDAHNAVMFGLGAGMLTTMFTVPVIWSSIGREREAYWQSRAASYNATHPAEIVDTQPDGWTPVLLPTGQRAWHKDATPIRQQAAFQASADTFTRLVVEQDDETLDQTTIIDVSWGMWTIANRLQQVGGWTEAAWDRARVFPSINHYRAIRDYMIARHLLRWKNPAAHRAGVELTRSGACVMDHLRGLQSAPSPVYVPVQVGFTLA